MDKKITTAPKSATTSRTASATKPVAKTQTKATTKPASKPATATTRTPAKAQAKPAPKFNATNSSVTIKESQLCGVISILMGVFLFLPLMMNAIVSKATLGFMSLPEIGRSFLNILGEDVDGSALLVMISIVAFVTTLVSIGLIIYGGLLIANVKTEVLLGKVYVMVTAIAAAVILSLVIITFMTFWFGGVSGVKYTNVLSVGSGLISLLIFSIMSIVIPFIIKKFVTE